VCAEFFRKQIFTVPEIHSRMTWTGISPPHPANHRLWGAPDRGLAILTMKIPIRDRFSP